jgi:nucleoside-diphosphate-sugar epimerase
MAAFTNNPKEQIMNHVRTALVLGATGGIGGAVAHRLQASGWQIRALHREAADQRANATAGAQRFEWVPGDAMSRDDVTLAAQGAALIVHAVNPPGYRNWGRLVLPMLDNSIAAARQSGARILFPGTVYNYGPDAFPCIDVDAPQRPQTRKGAIRVEMERRLEAASHTGVRSLIVRAGDFFGPVRANSWLSQAMVKPGQPVKTVFNPGTPGIGHQWAYLPDVAETMCRLVQLDYVAAPSGYRLEAFARFHMDGHWDADGMHMAAALARLANEGGQPAKVRPVNWRLMRALALFVPTLREVQEMRYLWHREVRLDNRRLLAVLGREPHTPLDDALRATLAGMACLPRQTTTSARVVTG